MQIKLTEPGFEHYTGMMGLVHFEDGVSEPITQREADQIAAAIRTESIDGLAGGARVLAAQNDRAEVVEPTARDSESTGDEETAESEEQTSAVDLEELTEDNLARIADEQGIQGLREIADPLGIKGRAINELISELVAYANGHRKLEE